MKHRDAIRPKRGGWPAAEFYWLLPGLAVPVINMALVAAVAIWNPAWPPFTHLWNTVLIAVPLLVEWACLTVVLARLELLVAWRVIVTLVVLVVVSFALVAFVFVPIGYGINCSLHPQDCQS